MLFFLDKNSVPRKRKCSRITVCLGALVPLTEDFRCVSSLLNLFKHFCGKLCFITLKTRSKNEVTIHSRDLKRLDGGEIHLKKTNKNPLPKTTILEILKSILPRPLSVLYICINAFPPSSYSRDGSSCNTVWKRSDDKSLWPISGLYRSTSLFSITWPRWELWLRLN